MYALLLVLIGALSPALARTFILVDAPASAPVGVSNVVEHWFASFSLPLHFLVDFAGNKSSPNLFSRDILDLLSQRSGVHPQIRVGGTSADRATFNSSQLTAIVQGGVVNGIPFQVSIGNSRFESFQTFPGTRWIFQVNLANQEANRVDNAVEEAKLAVQAIGCSLDAFEIGNEPDFYVGLGERNSTYNVTEYVREWSVIADAISEQVLKGNKHELPHWRLFQAGALAFKNFTKTFSTRGIFEAGIDRTGHVKSVSHHQYLEGAHPWGLTRQSSALTLMNHTAVAKNVTQYDSDVEFLASNYPGVKFSLGETNSDWLNVNAAQVEGVFGSALFLLDFILTGMVSNITNYNLIQGTTFGYTGWVPIEQDGRSPYVRPPLYAQIVTADILGSDTHNIFQISSVDLGLETFSAYAVYNRGKLAKYVLINLHAWHTITGGSRPMQAVLLRVPHQVKSVQAEVLTAPGYQADEGVTWGGHSWNYTDGRLVRAGRRHTAKILPLQGVAEVAVGASEAVVLTLSTECL